MQYENARSRKYTVTEHEIRRFIQATGDDDSVSRYYDSENQRWVAPPLFCQSMAFDDVPLSELDDDLSPVEISVDVPAQRTVGGSSHYEFLRPVYEGDQIFVTSGVKSITKKEGKSGTLYLVSVETCFENQNKQTVAKEVATYVKR